MERSVTEELADVLKKKKVDFLTLNQLNDALSAELRERLGLAKGSKGAQIEKALSPYRGEAFTLKRLGKSTYLIFKLPEEVLLFRILQKNNWKISRIKTTPDRKSVV